MLGIEVDLQNQIFFVWYEFMELCIGEDKSKGKYQECILDIAAGSAAELNSEDVLYQNARTKARTTIFKVFFLLCITNVLAKSLIFTMSEYYSMDLPICNVPDCFG